MGQPSELVSLSLAGASVATGRSVSRFHRCVARMYFSGWPVDSRLVGAASTVLDHHDTVATKSKLDDLVENLAAGNVSTPHTANVALPDDIVPVTERTVPKPKADVSVPTMLDLDDLDL